MFVVVPLGTECLITKTPEGVPTNDAGIVKRVLRLFDELAKADEKGLLKEARAAAAGE